MPHLLVILLLFGLIVLFGGLSLYLAAKADTGSVAQDKNTGRNED